MARVLVSRKTLNEFREYMVSWVLREIDDEFSAAGIPLAKNTTVNVRSGVRRLQVELYYASLDLTKPEDAAKLASVFENVLSNAGQVSSERMSDLLSWLEKDGYMYEEGRLFRLSVPGMRRIASKFTAMDTASIHDEIR